MASPGLNKNNETTLLLAHEKVVKYITMLEWKPCPSLGKLLI